MSGHAGYFNRLHRFPKPRLGSYSLATWRQPTWARLSSISALPLPTLAAASRMGVAKLLGLQQRESIKEGYRT